MKVGMLIATAVLAMGISQSHAGTITVTSLNDSGPGTLRTALASAADGDTINFSVTGTISQFSGELLATNSIEIIGPGPDLLAINRVGGYSRVFHIGSNIVVSISSLTITRGLSEYDPFGGAGIYSDHATLIISNCAVTHGYAIPYGGAIYNDHGKLTISACTLEGNSAGSAGGVYNDGNGGTASLEIVNSTVSSNWTVFEEGMGGGIFNNGQGGSAAVRIVGSIVNDNIAYCGGGIYNFGNSGIASVVIANSTLSSNWAYGSYGGGIENIGARGTATVEIINSALSSNEAGYFSYYAGYGGGIDNLGGNVDVANSTLSGNSATSRYGRGGGINNRLGTFRVLNSTLSSNLAANGGGVFNEGYDSAVASLEISNSTLNGNSATNGNGIYNYGVYGSGTVAVQIVNSTLSGNSATNTEFGSDIYNFADSFGGQGGLAILQIVNSTLSGNSATNAILNSGIYNVADAPGTAIVMIASTVLDAGVSGLNVTNDLGTVTSLGYNLSSDDGGGFLTATGDQTNTNPMLGPLQDNGGPTFTCALLPGSPAINAGDPNFDPYAFDPPLLYDQRGTGFPRVVCGRIDIGAFEVQDTPVITCPSNIVRNATSPDGAVVDFTVTATDKCSSVSVSSTPASGSVFATGDTTVSCLATNETGYQATCSFTVHIKGAAEQIDDLIVLVRSLNLKPWTAYILTAELQSASNALRRGNTRFACGDVDAFMFEVDVQTWWGQIRPLPRARLLVRDAQRIQNVLGCHDGFGDGRP